MEFLLAHLRPGDSSLGWLTSFTNVILFPKPEWSLEFKDMFSDTPCWHIMLPVLYPSKESSTKCDLLQSCDPKCPVGPNTTKRSIAPPLPITPKQWTSHFSSFWSKSLSSINSQRPSSPPHPDINNSFIANTVTA